MNIEVITVGPFAENTYLVSDGGDAVLIDPGDEADRLLNLIDRSSATPRAIWVTHGHLDHIGAIAGVRRRFDVPIYLHEADLPLYRAGSEQATFYGVPFEQPPEPDHGLAEGDVVTVGSLSFDVWHLPGHAPGHVAFVGHGVLLGGDLLFQGSIGRTDLPLSDGVAMEQSLARLALLPPNTQVFPGHGPATTIGEEVESNPFMIGLARPRKAR